MGTEEEACLAVSVDPVSIWTTCLNEEVSACTNVVGYGLADSDLVTGFGGYGEGGAATAAAGEGAVGVRGGNWVWCSPLLLVLLQLLLELWLLRGEGRRFTV